MSKFFTADICEVSNVEKVHGWELDSYKNLFYGYGDTAAEATENLRESKRNSKRVEIIDEHTLCAAVAIPEGYGLLILNRWCHMTGAPGEWRIFAIKSGLALRLHGKNYVIGENPILYSFSDNSDDKFYFPNGSSELAEEGWRPCRVAKYRR